MKQAKPIKHHRCKHMPTPDNTVVIFSSKVGSNYEVGFTIGNQDFTVSEQAEKETAKFMCDMLKTAFETLVTPKVIYQLKSQENREMVMNNLSIKIINKG